MSVNADIPTKAQVRAMTDAEHKVTENRLRRAAIRQGLRLERSRSRDPRALGYGTYRLVNAKGRIVTENADLHDIARKLFGSK